VIATRNMRDAMTRRDGVTALCFFLLGVYVAWEGFALSPGTPHKPGAGFQPVVLGVAFMGLALIYLAMAIPARRTAGAPWPFRLWRRPLLGAVAILGYWFCLTLLGFVPTTLLFMLYWLGVVERESWRRIAAVSVGTTAGLYLAFTWILKIRLPTGILF
jgi:putative tricarboxylic transport membrane protein